MPEITAQLVRQLREMSGAGMMECKKALTSTDGDIDAALDELRKAGLKSAAKKVGRETAEGRVGVKVSDDGKTGAIVALATETDFLASTPGFIEFHQALVDQLTTTSPARRRDARAGLVDRRHGPGGPHRQDRRDEGEPPDRRGLRLLQRRWAGRRLRAPRQQEGRARQRDDPADAAKAGDTLKQLGMHVVVFSPSALDESGVPESDVEREKDIIRDGLKGKPEDIQEKIMVGRLRSSSPSAPSWAALDHGRQVLRVEGPRGRARRRTKIDGFTRAQLG